ncbi:hypothetical protein M0802_007254 [Mischocyttarus mexicanus]|nr:hypothetical protein M0802_007254 [Mischocyttarus mexicanus]
MSRVDLKVVLLGSAAVGKTSLSGRFINEAFDEDPTYRNTIGVAFSAKQMEIDGHKIVMGIWDTAGNERYESMTRIYYRGAKAAVVCFDVTMRDTFRKAKFWIRELRAVEEECKIYLVGTKTDILPNPDIIEDPSMDIVMNYVNGIQAKFFLTSSKTGRNVAELFTEIARDFLSVPKNLQKIEETVSLTITPKRSHCC